MKKNIRYFVGFFYALGLLAGAAQVQAKETLTVGYLPILDHLALLVSHTQDNASFRDVEIKPRLFKSWPAMTGALKG